MSTRGAIGFVLDGTEKITYNHSDSYPSWLGVRMLAFAKTLKPGSESQALTESQVANLKIVDEMSKPTDEEKSKLKASTNLNVGTQSDDDWYCVLRDNQGDLDATLDSGYMIDGADFCLDSLSCEWAYIVNLDTGFLEIYEGFQTEPHEKGRFADRFKAEERRGDNQYYPIKLVEAWSLGELPDEETFLNKLEPTQEEE